MSSHRYERHYDVGLLDDLHNFFPALLYDPAGFSTVQDVLTYVREQAQRRFDLFSAGQRAYGPPAAAARSSTPPPRRPLESPSVAPAPPQARRARRTTAPPPEEEVTVTVESLGHDLNLAAGLMDLMMPRAAPPRMAGLGSLNLLNAMLGAGMGGGVALPPNWNEPVPVRPTAAQIQAASVIEIVDAEEEVCAICQDGMPPGSQARCLNHCDHRFHVGCIDTWFQRDVHCPVCRNDIRDTSASEDTS